MKKNLLPLAIFLSSMFFCQPVKGQIIAEILIEVLWEFGIEPLFIPRDGLPVTEPYYTKYPYENKEEGRYKYIGEEGRSMSGKLLLGVQTGEKDVLGLNGQLEFSPLPAITLDLNYQQYSLGQSFNNNQSFRLSNMSFRYNRYRRNRFYFWWDGGVSNIQGYSNEASAILSEWGGSLGVGCVWFIRSPLSLETSYRTHVFENRSIGVFDIKLRLHLKEYFVDTGWQNQNQSYDNNVMSVGIGRYF